MHRWGVRSNIQVILIILTFALTGSASLFLSDIIIESLQITSENTPVFLYWGVFISSNLLVYQIVLLLIGSLLGQFSFFWEFEKRVVKKIWSLKKMVFRN